jgi:hypothetical protein
MPWQSRARLLTLTLTALKDSHLYAGKVRTKAIGEAAATSFEWHPLGIEPTPSTFAWMPLPVTWFDLPVNP